MSRFSYVSLDFTLNRPAAKSFEARIPAGTSGFCVIPAQDPAEYPVGVFPKAN
jgi:hypothetical protein